MNTIDYYNKNAGAYVTSTVAVDFKDTQDRFIEKLPGKSVLDLGCGSGRDTKYFLEAGLNVTAIDGSAELCRLASAYTGIPVKQMLFQELDESNRYDGIWACSSILHLPEDELLQVFQNMTAALKNDGIIYTSFKYGNFQGERNGRFFIDFTKETFRKFLKQIPKLRELELWTSGDVRPGRNDERWLNVLLKK